MKVLHLLKRDLKNKNNKNSIIGLSIVLLMVIFVSAINLDSTFNFINLFFDILKGPEIKERVQFDFPINWIIINSSIAFLIGSYFYDDLKHGGENAILKSGTINNFIYSKVIWMIINILKFYFILFLEGVIIFFILSKSNFNSGIHNKGQIFQFITKDLSLSKIIIYILIVYITTSVAMSMLQMTLSIIIKPKYSYLIVSAMMILNSICNCVWLPYAQCSLLKQSLFNINSNLNLVFIIMYNLIVFLVSLLSISLYLNKKDISRG